MGYTILKLSDAWTFTAEAQNLLSTSEELMRRGHRVVLACKPGSPLAQRAQEKNVVVREIKGFRPGWNILAAAMAWPTVAKVLKEENPDILHAYRSSVHVIGLVARWLVGCGVPLLRTRSNIDPPRRSWGNRLLYNRWTQRTIVPAQIVRNLMTEAGLEDGRVINISGAVDIDRFHPRLSNREKVRKELGIPEDALVVGCVARLAPIKGHKYLLEAASRLFKSYDRNGQLRPWFVLVGPAWPGMWEEVRKRAEELGIIDHLIWTGRYQDVSQVVGVFDIGVVASVGSEALSRATLEYMATEIPVVATKVGGIPEILPDGKAGVLVPPGDPESMAQALEDLLSDESRRKEMGRFGRKTVEELHTIQRQVDQLETIYSEALEH